MGKLVALYIKYALLKYRSYEFVCMTEITTLLETEGKAFANGTSASDLRLPHAEMPKRNDCDERWPLENKVLLMPESD